MKHLKLVVTLLLISVMAFSLGFASKGTGLKSAPVDQGTTNQITQISNDPELRTGRVPARSFRSDLIEQTSNPAMILPADKGAARAAFSLGLSGPYAIPGDFPSISAAIAVLNFVGVSGNVTFNIAAGSYSVLSPLAIGAFPGAGTFTVSIQPAAGAAVTINFQPSATEGKGFSFNGAQDVTVDGLNTGGASLTLQYAGGTFPASDAFAATIYVTGGSDGITVQNANIKGNIQTSGAFYDQTDGRPAVFVFRGVSTPANKNIAVTGCTITNATYGLKVLTGGLAASADVNGPNISFTYNNVGGAYGGMVSIGGLMDKVSEMHYDNNVFDGIEFVPYYWENGPTEFDNVSTFGNPVPSFMYDFGQPTAGHMYNTANSTCKYNWIKDSHQSYNDPGFAFIIYGLLARVGGTTAVQNNRITGVHTTDLDGTDAPLRTESGASHNSIRLTGTQTASQVSYCLRPAAGNVYNNALSNERTGSAGSGIRVLQGTPTGLSDGNAFYGTNGRINTSATLAGYFATGKDANSQYGPVNFDATMHIVAGPSSAENIGRPKILLAVDIDGDVRDTTTAGTRDAGADEFPNTGSPTASDVLPTLISPPNPAGEPFGLPIPMKVTVKNNSATATGAFDVMLGVSDGYSNTVNTTLAALETKILTFPNWSPAAAGSYTLTATTLLGGDATPGNDVLVRAQTAVVPVAIVGDTVVFNAASAEGWAGTGSFVFSSAFTKFGGPYSGAAFITGAGAPHTVPYTNATAHTVTSPFYSLASLGGDGNVYISFYQALTTEPSWDRAWVQYTTDNVNWINLGSLNDPNGVNWYSTAVYANAAGSNAAPDCWDGVTAVGLGLAANTTDIPPAWTSNGDCETEAHTGPNGFVYTQLKITPANYPAVVGAPLIRFRYVAFADAGANDDGWAIDNLRIGGTANPLLTADFGGNVYGDTDGNGAKNGGESGIAGVTLNLTYFGVPVASAVSDVNGDYNFVDKLSAPGSYKVTATTALSISQPVAGSYTDAYTGNGVDRTGKHFGLYDGSVSGKKYSDVNDNGVNDAEPGLAGWTIEAHKDSCNGPLVASDVTDGSGNYYIPLLPGTYCIKEVAQPGVARQTGPVGGTYTVTISGTSGGGTAVLTGKDFGNFVYGVLKIEAFQDINGDGIRNPDVNPLPSGITTTWELKKGATSLAFITVGNTGAFGDYDSLDTGSYTLTNTSNTAGTARTFESDGLNDGAFAFSISTSGQLPNLKTMLFKMVSVSGTKFNDIDGDGVKDGGEPGLAGWTISVSGTVYGSNSAVTDVNGDYSIDSVGGGGHTMSEAPQAGWQQTLAGGGFSGTFGVNATGKNFGNFDQVCISGTKYRDRNNDGNQDAGEEGLAGWKITLNPGALSATTDANGDFSFCNVGPGSYTLAEVVQVGWVQTEPTTPGTYTIITSSGTDVGGNMFGNYKSADDAKYRTFTAAELQPDNQKKPVKRAKPGKPILMPNTANVLAEMFIQGGSQIQVGIPLQMLAGKEKGYVKPAKSGDVWKTLNAKSTFHSAAPSPLDFYNGDVKRILKLQKSLPATKHNNVLLANLMALEVSIEASADGKTPVGLGSVLYNEAGEPFDGMSYDEIADSMRVVMTNWETVDPAFWADANDVIVKLNDAFKDDNNSIVTTGAFGAEDTVSWNATLTTKLALKGVRTAADVAYLKASGIPAKNRFVATPTEKPTVFALKQNYPNPFNPTTTISFDLVEPSFVTLKIYNMLGQEVATLLDHVEMEDGDDMEFDASSLSSGVYLYRIVSQTITEEGGASQTHTQVKKMVLMK